MKMMKIGRKIDAGICSQLHRKVLLVGGFEPATCEFPFLYQRKLHSRSGNGREEKLRRVSWKQYFSVFDETKTIR